MIEEPMLKKKVKNNKNYGILAIMLVAITLIGGVYAFFQYYREGDETSKLLAGDVYLHYVDGESAFEEGIILRNAFPETDEEAREREDTILNFTIKGVNTTSNKDIYYEIKLLNGKEVNGKKRLNDKDIKFDLIETTNGNPVTILNGVSFDTINNTKIWVNTINRNNSNEIIREYQLRMWISDEVTISDTDINATYTTGEYFNSYASVKVSVFGDFNEKVVTYNLNGGSVSGNPANYTIETATFTLKNPTRTGHTFVGWTGSNGSTASTSVSIAKGSYGAKTYTATWTANKYTITFNPANGGSTFTRTATYGAAMPAAGSAPSATGYRFNGYYYSGTQYYTAAMASARTWNRTANTTLTGSWTALTYTITFNPVNGGGTFTRTATYGKAMPNAGSAPSATGHYFNGYYYNGTQYYNSSMGSARNWNRTANTTLTASWSKKQYTVTLNQNGGWNGTGTVYPYWGNNMPGATKPTRTGHNFNGYIYNNTWYYNSGMGSARTWNVDGNVTLTASWTAITYTITLDNQNGSTTTKYVNYGGTFSNTPGRSSNGHSLTFTGYWTGRNCTGTQITWGGNASGAVYGSATYYAGWLSCWPSGWYASHMNSRFTCGGTGNIKSANGSARSIFGVTTKAITNINNVYAGKWYVIPRG